MTREKVEVKREETSGVGHVASERANETSARGSSIGATTRVGTHTFSSLSTFADLAVEQRSRVHCGLVGVIEEDGQNKFAVVEGQTGPFSND